MQKSDSVHRFQEFLKLPTVSGEGPSNGSYDKASTLLASWMMEIGCVNIRRIEYVCGKPVVLGTIPGMDDSLPTILLNGHYDVVPIQESTWSVPAFEGRHDPSGRIYGRGTQDMKSVVVQYLEALRTLNSTPGNPVFRRTIHLSFLPDEEVGGLDGASRFVASDEFRKLNVGIALDEGLANPENAYSLFYGERASNWVIIRATGPTGHGSRFIKNTAIEKISRILTRIYSMRQLEEHRCHSHNLKLGDVLSMNVTAMRAGVPSSTLRGGYAINVIPSEAEIAIDIRVPLDVDNIEAIIHEQWIQDETDVSVDFVDRNAHPNPGILSRPVAEDKWVSSVCRAIKSIHGNDFRVDLDVFPAGTDGRYIRRAGVPCIGFSPMRNTPILLHDNDEYIDEQVFLEGIDVFAKVIPALASME
jgi:aminoacylase